MDLRDPPVPDITEQNRRQFLQRTSAASLAAAIGLSGGASAQAFDDDGEFTADPFSLGVASGDPLPDSVILWTRLAPEPLAPGGGMPDEPVDVAWTVATDEALTDIVTEGTTTAESAHAHTVHVDASGLESNTEYYYQFEARGATSTVGRTKTAPASDEAIDEFRLGFASCQRWVDGYYTAHRYMAEDGLDLIVHLGDYIYEYGIGADGGARDATTPQAYRQEIESLEQYRLRYSLYKSDPDLRAAHASAPWLITRDDHEVDNNWAGDTPEDPDQQTTRAFLERRAAAFKAYYEHMPFRMEQQPAGPDQKLYRNYQFGDLLAINVLDTRLYRSDQACGDAFNVVDCQERFAEDRTILGDEQGEWLVSNLQESTATWDVLANQLPLAKMDFNIAAFGREDLEPEGFRMDQWDGYAADQNTVLRAFDEDAENPIVVTGDFHRSWANDLRSPDDESTPVGAEFVGTSISAAGDGSDMDAFGRQVIRDNDNVEYYSNRRGYARCTVTPEEWTTEYRTVEYVTERSAPARTDAEFTVKAGEPGLQPNPPRVFADAVAVGNGKTGTARLKARWLSEGLSGGTMTVSLSDPGVATVTGASVDDAFGVSETDVAADGSSVTLRFADIDTNVQPVVGGVDVPLAEVELRGDATGTTDLEVTVDRLDEEDGTTPEAETNMGVLIVGPPPVGGGRAPTDLDGDGYFEDVNGNGRLDYDDITTLFDGFESDAVRLNEAAYDFNENGQLDYDDVVTLYEEI